MTQWRAAFIALVIAGLLGWISTATNPRPSSPNGSEITTTTVTLDRPDGGVSEVSLVVHDHFVKEHRNRGWVVLVPSLGRGAKDFTQEFGSNLADSLADRGYAVLLIEPRGIGQSTGSLDPQATTMAMLSDDLKAVFDTLEIDRVALVGHAFGNRLSRYFATQHPDRVSGLIILAAGGDFELSQEQLTCLFGSFDLASPEEERRAHVACAFFAEGNDPDVWMEGWYPKVALAQVAAAQSVQSDEFKRAGGLPFLLVQPTADFIAPPDLAGQAVAAELGDQVTYIEIEGAGHALLPEAPQALSQIVGDYLDAHLTNPGR